MALARTLSKRQVAGFCTAALLALAAGPSPARAASLSCPDCNVIMISLSNVSANRMSLYGYPRRTTPRLDRWARQAVVFDNGFTPASWTMPVAASVFTSLQPYAHQMLYRTLHNTLGQDLPTLPEILRDHGYRTAAFTGGLDYYAGFSFMRGFQDQADNPEFTGFATTLPQAKAWLAKNSARRFFLFIHGYDSHCPFIPSQRYRGRFSDPKETSGLTDEQHCVRGLETDASTAAIKVMRFEACSSFELQCEYGTPAVLTPKDLRFLSDIYDEKLVEMDALVGDFLDELDRGLLKKTIIVIYADHGEMFAKHGRFGRAGNMRGTPYDDVLRVPLLMRLPGGPARRAAGLAQLIDIMPTLLPSLGLPPPPGMQGVDLAPMIATGTALNPYVYSGANYNICAPSFPAPHPFPFCTQSESIRDTRWKLIRELFFDGSTPLITPERKPVKIVRELYDIRADPEELNDLVSVSTAVAQDLEAKLAAWKRQAEAYRPGAPATTKIPERMQERARARGYW
ncbi:MAG: sulfatase [Elusimicrobia bacterium]|nr:sulfatase [Elusimicrobiota bacterium]